MKAADLDDREILETVAELVKNQGHWTNTSAVAENFPAAPFKVVHAKLRQLHKRNLLSGCPCGCRGDWELTAAGKTLL